MVGVGLGLEFLYPQLKEFERRQAANPTWLDQQPPAPLFEPAENAIYEGLYVVRLRGGGGRFHLA